MTPDELRQKITDAELIFATSRSSGPGGQNVNKVNTRVEVRFRISSSTSLTEYEKDLIFSKLKNKINSEGELIVTSQSGRTQLSNRNKAVEKLYKLISSALTENPARRPTVPTKKSKLERLEEKRKRGLLKKLRKEGDQDRDQDHTG